MVRLILIATAVLSLIFILPRLSGCMVFLLQKAAALFPIIRAFYRFKIGLHATIGVSPLK